MRQAIEELFGFELLVLHRAALGRAIVEFLVIVDGLPVLRARVNYGDTALVSRPLMAGLVWISIFGLNISLIDIFLLGMYVGCRFSPARFVTMVTLKVCYIVCFYCIDKEDIEFFGVGNSRFTPFL